MITPSTADTPPLQVVETIVALLDEAADVERDTTDIGKRAASLWWQLDAAGLAGAEEVPVWEEALLAMATWHTGDNRLRDQGPSAEEAVALRHGLTG